MTTTTTNLTRSLLAMTVVAGALAVLPGCRGDRSDKPPRQFFPDMDDSPKWKPQTRTDFYEDRREMRQPVPGTVAFGRSTDAADPARADLLREDTAFYTGLGADGKPLVRIPASFVVDAKAIERGQQRFDIYCSVCHGFDGASSGTVAQLYSVLPANLHAAAYTDPALETSRDGYLFGVIRNGLWDVQGKMRMPSYGHAIKEQDAWAVVAYIRTLQAWRSGNRNDIPEAIRAEIDKRAAVVPTSTAPAAATPAAPAPEKKP